MTVVSQNSIIQNLMPQASTGDGVERVDGTKSLGKDAFLKLLVAQMKHQDPLNPMEGVEFTSQLAQFTQLEQLYQLNDSFGEVNSSVQNQSNMQTLSLVGKEVRAVGRAVSVTGGEATLAVFNIEEPAQSVVVNIYNVDGDKVRTLDLGPTGVGTHDIEWDGRDSSGAVVEDGPYLITVLASDGSGNSIETATAVEGRVTGMGFDENGIPQLLLNGTRINLSDVIEITEPARTESEAS